MRDRIFFRLMNGRIGFLLIPDNGDAGRIKSVLRASRPRPMIGHMLLCFDASGEASFQPLEWTGERAWKKQGERVHLVVHHTSSIQAVKTYAPEEVGLAEILTALQNTDPNVFYRVLCVVEDECMDEERLTVVNANDIVHFLREDRSSSLELLREDSELRHRKSA